jgi:folylpolyglutamate synthase/dihydropteroate synthase
MLEALGATQASQLVCCRPDSPRGMSPDDVARAAIQLGMDPDRIEVIDDVRKAVRHAIDGSEPDEQVIVTGSLYVVSPARAMLVPPTGR